MRILILITTCVFLLLDQSIANKTLTESHQSESVKQTTIEKLLPKPLQFIKVGLTTENEIKKHLGKAKVSDPDGYRYYSLFGIKYDVTIEIKNNKVHSLYVDLSQKNILYSTFNPIFTSSLLEDAYKNEKQNENTHEYGRTLLVKTKMNNLMLTAKTTFDGKRVLSLTISKIP